MKLWAAAFVLTILLILPVFAARDCSSFYDLFSANVSSLTLDKNIYSVGELVHGSFIMQDKFGRPLPEGTIKVQVLYIPTDNETRYGEHIIDEFYLQNTFDLRANESRKIDFYYIVPQNTKQGTYRLAFYVYSGSYQLGGASFVPGLYADSITFNVLNNNPNYDLLKFGRGSIYVSGRQYDPTATIGIERDQNESIVVSVPLTSEGLGGIVNVTYEVQAWDDIKNQRLYNLAVNGMLPQDSAPYQEMLQLQNLRKNELIPLAQNSSASLNYSIGKLLPEAYVVRITAMKDNQKAILLIRLPIKGEKAGIAYSTLDSFPLPSSQAATISSCLSVTTESEPIVTLGELTLVARNGSVLNFRSRPIFKTQINATLNVELLSGNSLLFENSTGLLLTAEPQGIDFQVRVPENISKATLMTRIYEGAKLLDEETVNYDIARLKESRSLVLALNKIPGEVHYDITVVNELGEDEAGTVNVIAVTSNGSVAAAAQNVSFLGTTHGTFLLPGDNYTISVYDTLNNLHTSSTVAVEKPYVPGTSGSFAKDPLVLISIAMVLAALLLIAYKYLNKK